MECFGDSYTVDRRLFLQVVMSTILMTGAVIPPIYMLPDTMNFEFGGDNYVATPWKIFGCIAMGLWSGLIIGGSTEYYTSNAYSPVQDIARSTKYGPAPVIIKGLALGYLSNIIPISGHRPLHQVRPRPRHHQRTCPWIPLQHHPDL